MLASAEESWSQLQVLRVRVQDLEFALEQAHRLIAHDRHPLLEDELIRIGRDPRAVIKTKSGKSLTAPLEGIPIPDFGAMKISKSGSFRGLGVCNIITFH